MTKKSSWAEILEMLPEIENPAQYLGLEDNAYRKKFETSEIKFCIVFPDLYSIGMSYLGTQIIYGLVNNETDMLCERAYLPMPDFIRKLTDSGHKLFSLESRKPLDFFDVIGFSLNTERNYINILHILNLAQIPLKSSERNENHPLIIAGGTNALHPAPIQDFIDVFFLGEAEVNLVEFLRMHNKLKKEGLNRTEILLELAKNFENIYVPTLYDYNYNADNKLTNIKPKYPEIASRKAAYTPNLDQAFYPLNPLVPIVDTVHNRAVIEIMRGCTQGCRFCQAGITYRPQRYRSVETLTLQADEILKNTGYDEISLLSLSSSDYPYLVELIDKLNLKYVSKNINVALPSLRVSDQLGDIIAKTQVVRKSGLTIAPEAATQRLRNVINKNITNEDLFAGVKNAFSQGFNQIKLYFMLGLPTETDEDASEIAKLMLELLRTAKSANPRKTPTFRITLSPFVPKPHTPFQWAGQTEISILERRINLIRSMLKNYKHNIQISWHNPHGSILEAALARGDSRLSEIILSAYKKGAILDNWENHFNFKIWEDAFAEAGKSIYAEAQREFNPDDVLPWQHINSGVSKEFLLRENLNAIAEKPTLNCQDSKCNICGLDVKFCLSKDARP